MTHGLKYFIAVPITIAALASVTWMVFLILSGPEASTRLSNQERPPDRSDSDRGRKVILFDPLDGPDPGSTPDVPIPSAGRAIPKAEHPSSSLPRQAVASFDFAAEIDRFLEAGKHPGRDEAFSLLLREWASHDPAAAVSYARSLRPETFREAAVRHVVQSWTGSDPSAALRWASLLPDAVERRRGMEQVSTYLSESDPAHAIHLAERYGMDQTTPNVLSNIVVQWANADLLAAYDWVNRQPRSERRDDWMARIAFTYAHVDPSEAVRVAIEDISSSEAQTEAILSVLHQWALRDMKSAMRWLADVPPGPIRERAVSELEGLDFYYRLIPDAP